MTGFDGSRAYGAWVRFSWHHAQCLGMEHKPQEGRGLGSKQREGTEASPEQVDQAGQKQGEQKLPGYRTGPGPRIATTDYESLQSCPLHSSWPGKGEDHRS